MQDEKARFLNAFLVPGVECAWARVLVSRHSGGICRQARQIDAIINLHVRPLCKWTKTCFAQQNVSPFSKTTEKTSNDPVMTAIHIRLHSAACKKRHQACHCH